MKTKRVHVVQRAMNGGLVGVFTRVKMAKHVAGLYDRAGISCTITPCILNKEVPDDALNEGPTEGETAT